MKDIEPTSDYDLKYLNLNEFSNSTIGFVLPENNKDETIIKDIIKNDIFSNCYINYINFENIQQLNISYNNSQNFILAAVIFESEDYLNYTIRVNSTTTPNPKANAIGNYAEIRYITSDKSTDADRYLNLFTPIQMAIDQSIIRMNTKNNKLSINYSFGKLGKSAIDYSSNVSSNDLPYLISILYICSVTAIVTNVVQEKELKIKENLIMMGIHPSIFWVSWLIIYSIMIFIISLIITLFFFFGHIFKGNALVVLFFSIFLYGLSCCNISFLFSTVFNKTKTANSAISIFMLSLSLLNFVNSSFSDNLKIIFSFLLSPISIGSLINDMNINKYNYNHISLLELLKSESGIFLFGIFTSNIIYFVMTLIFDVILNFRNGFLNYNSKLKDIPLGKNNMYKSDIQEDIIEENKSKCTVEICNIYKNFKNKLNENFEENLVLNNINFKVYENEIFAILGHNGAGKSTLINIMTGVMKSSYGDVYYNGKGISKNRNELRKEFGICCQNNIIYDEFTVKEHIKFYSDLKNVKVNVDEILDKVNLVHQKDLKASKLSGGQKRKLCICMAIIGNPKYIFLDEPTTGLDPLSRRSIWELLIKIKKNKTIFFTTHYMDEADILADRKLILNKGKIRCLGTSLYLKNHFNMGYILNVETNNKDYINTLIKNEIPNAKYIHSSGNFNKNEKNRCYSWKLPLNMTFKFSSLLNILDQTINEKDPSMKYSLSMPSLEELFIRLEDNIIHSKNYENLIDVDNEKESLLTVNDQLPKLKPIKKTNKFRVLLNLVRYRLKIFIRNKAFAFTSILLPFVSSLLIFFLFNNTFVRNELSSDSNVLSVSSMYNNNIINFEPQLFKLTNISKENIIFLLNNNKNNSKNNSKSNNNMIHTNSLNEIKSPSYNSPYYFSSVWGEKEGNNYNFKIYYNDTMVHSIPTTINTLSNIILLENGINKNIILKSQVLEINNPQISNTNLLVVNLLISSCFIMALIKFAPLILNERINYLLHQLQLNGVTRNTYWLSCFITDYSIFIFSIGLIVLSGVLAKFELLLNIRIIMVLLILLIIWSIPAILFQYILSFLFDQMDTIYTYIYIINFCSILLGYILLFIIDLKNSTNITVNISKYNYLYDNPYLILNIVLTLFSPLYSILPILNSLFSLEFYNKSMKYELNIINILKFRNGITPVITCSIILIFIYYGILIKLDKKKNQTNKSDIRNMPERVLKTYEKILEEGDEDVKNEFDYVKTHQNELPICVYHINKEFSSHVPKNKKREILRRDSITFNYGETHQSPINGKFVKTAVIDVNFGVRNHECFGLLGPNGAGKSTTINIISSIIPQTTGKITFNGIENYISRLNNFSMGFCSQIDILWNELTIREHLELFLKIHGYNNEDARFYASQFINIAGIEEHQNKRIEKLSGGTKRKLSLLIAICRYPKYILLDEPTGGMDPSTRRLIWNIIKKVKSENNTSIILTTHSLEEAENLCDRLSILVNGRLSCIGSPEHLKLKFGKGYILEICCSNIEKFHNEIIVNGKLFGNEDYQMEKLSFNRVKYSVKLVKKLGEIFEVMENCKTINFIKDYSFSQISLEQVFIDFARKQVMISDD